MAEKNFCSSLPLVNVCYILFLFMPHCHFHKWLGIYTHQAAVSRLIVFAGSELGMGRAETAAFEPMDAREETFYHEFCTRTQDLRGRWVAAAIREPYEAARAHVSGDASALEAVRRELADVNEQSFRQFVRLAKHFA